LGENFFFVNFKYLSFGLVLFACERISDMGAPTAIFVAAWQNPPLGWCCMAESATGTILRRGIRHGDDAKKFKIYQMLLTVV
jgi:hypothetical protein